MGRKEIKENSGHSGGKKQKTGVGRYVVGFRQRKENLDQ